jgi:hypothetical protein
VEAIRTAMGPAWDFWGPACGKKVLDASKSILAKLDAAETAPSGVAVKPIEDALVLAGQGKVVALESGHATVSKRLTAMKVTAEDAAMVGKYLARSQFFSGPFTLIDVLNKWHSWLPKARVTEPPPTLQPGLNGTGQGPAPAGKATQGRRTPQGFR